MALRSTLQVRRFFCPCNNPVHCASILLARALCRLVASRHRIRESIAAENLALDLQSTYR